MSIKQITKQILTELKDFGAINWHTSKHNSKYIKFKDVRLGSIRIADHKGLSWYSYTYELTDISTEEEINQVISQIKLKSQSITNFDSSKFIVYSTQQRLYVEAPNFKIYKEHILKIKEL